VFDFVGMLGLPLAPCHEFPTKAPAAFFSVHALKDPCFEEELAGFIALGKPVLITDGLAGRLEGRVDLTASNVHLLAVKGDPKSLLQLTESELDKVRGPMLKPWGLDFKAPNQVGLYLFGDGSWVIENFTDEPIAAELRDRTANGSVQQHSIPAREWKYEWKRK
jgi:hypothetical protein